MTVDIKNADGDPWQVAQIAGRRTEKALIQASETMIDLCWAARGSWLSQEYHRTGTMPSREDFDASQLGKRLHLTAIDLEDTLKKVRSMTASASWDPRST